LFTSLALRPCHSRQMPKNDDRKRRDAEIATRLKEDPEGVLTDDALALEYCISYESVAVVRRAAGIPGAYKRRRLASGRVKRLARCWDDGRSYILPVGRDSMNCPHCRRRIHFNAISEEK